MAIQQGSVIYGGIMLREDYLLNNEEKKAFDYAFGKSKHCDICNKELLMLDWSQYAYKIEFRDKSKKKKVVRYYCTYTCLCKGQKEIENNKNYKISERRY